MIDLFLPLNISTHNINIITHISFGLMAIVLAFIQILNKKGDKLHKQIGRLFLICFSIVIFTAILGVFIFYFRPFLTILTFAAAYSCWGGYRVLKIKGRKPNFIDNTVSIFCIIACVIFMMTSDSFQINTSMVTIYATTSSLIMMCIYDLSRNAMNSEWLQRTWLKEHIYKMISALGALLSAAGGNMLESYGAWSQLSPNIICFILIIYFLFVDKTATGLKKDLTNRLSNAR